VSVKKVIPQVLDLKKSALTSSTLGAVTMHHGCDDTVCKGNRLVNGKPGCSDPKERKKAERIDIKLDMGDYVGDTTQQANFGAPALTGAGPPVHEVVNLPCLFFNWY